MPFCTQCGAEVQRTDIYCASCGASQGDARSAPQGPSAPGTGRHFLDGLDERRASTLCYIPLVGWVLSIVVLAADRFRDSRETRFHAFQGLYLFVAWLFVDWVFGPFASYAEPMRVVASGMKVAVFGAWIFMLVKTSQGEDFRLPLLGELADRSVAEQK